MGAYTRGMEIGSRIVGQGFDEYSRGQRRKERERLSAGVEARDFDRRAERANREASRRIESAKRRGEDVAFREREATRAEAGRTRREAGQVRRYDLLKEQIGAKGRTASKGAQNLRFRAAQEVVKQYHFDEEDLGYFGKMDPEREKEFKEASDFINRLSGGRARQPTPGYTPAGPRQEGARAPLPGQGVSPGAIEAERRRRKLAEGRINRGASGTWD